MKKQNRDDIVARADDAFKNSSYAEYSVEKKVEGKYKQKRIQMVFLYIAVFVAVLAIVIVISKFVGTVGILALPMFALAPLAIWIMVHFTWGMVSIEYKYVIDHSEFVLYTVYGGKTEKETFRCKVKEFELIAPINDEYKGKLEAFNAQNTIEAVPSLSSHDLYFALHTDENAKKTAVLFQVTNHSLKAFKYYNKDALIMTEAER